MEALDTLAVTYDIHDTNNSDSEPDAATLDQYEIVIWFTGDEYGGAAGPGATGETALAPYLDNGGCLFLSSQDYYFDRGLTPFMSNRLGVSSVVNDVSHSSVEGTGPFAGQGPFSLAYPFTNFSDDITPGATAVLAFSGDVANGRAAVAKDAGAYKTTYWGFPWEAIPASADPHSALQTVLTYCGLTVNPPR